MNRLSNQSQRLRKAGFSLIELLVVISIIMILAGITIAVVRVVKKKQDIELTKTRLQTIRLKLEDYATEQNGIYPVGQDSTSIILYKSLSGDYSGQGQQPTGPIYWPELNDQKNPSLVGYMNNSRVIFDGFGQSFRYKAALDANGEAVQGVKNDGDFDLWSIGPDAEPNDINVNGLLQNDQTQDDIWQ